jgi:serine/threonine protein kinase
VTLYILATGGRVPFMTAVENPAELFGLIAAHKRGSLVWEEPAPSANLRDLCERMLEPDPAQRISIAQIRQHPWMALDEVSYSPLAHDLQALAIGSPILVPSTD